MKISFVCATCGQRHEGPPGLSFDSPLHYKQMTPEEQAATAILTEDLCAIADRDFFVRVCLEVGIRDRAQPFVWGVWVSLSRTNFEHYAQTLGRPEETSGPYFGWLCNRLPGYPDTLHLRTHVTFRTGNLRPLAELEPTEHPLAIDQRSGMSEETLQRIVQAHVHLSNEPGV